jgi:hypothetical protein
MEVMEMSSLDKSLDGSIPEPNAAVDLASFRNWKSNNMRLISFLKANVDDGEKSFLATDNVHTTWNNLVDCHEKQGPITQVHLIQEVLFISYPKMLLSGLPPLITFKICVLAYSLKLSLLRMSYS